MVSLLVFAWIGSAQAQVPVDTPTFGKPVARERQGGDLGLGLGVGAPTGVVGKLWLSDWSAVQLSAGGDLGRIGDLALTADYLVEFRPFQPDSDEYSVPLHIGAGVNVSGNVYEWTGLANVLMGPRAVMGLSVLVRDLPVDIYVEAAPTFYVYQDLTWSFDGQFGAHYYW